MRPAFLFLTVLTAAATSLSGQPLGNWRVEYFNEEKGLAGRSSYSLMQDKQGYLWIGTADGLNRFDGYAFKTFRKIHGDQKSLGGNQVTHIIQDKDENIWVGFSTGGLSRYNQVEGRFTNYYPQKNNSKSLPADAISMLYMDQANTLWVGVRSNGLYRFDKESQSFIQYPVLPGIHRAYTEDVKKVYNTVYAMYEAPDGITWLATHNGLYQFDKAKGSYKEVRANPIDPQNFRYDLYQNILPGKDGKIWLSGWGLGITSYDPKLKQWENHRYDHAKEGISTKNIVGEIKWKSANEIWLATFDRGIGVFNTTTKKFEFVNDPTLQAQGVPMMYCYRVLEDRQGNTWLGHDNGLTKINSGSNLFSFKPVNVLRTDNGQFYSVTGIWEDTDRRELYLTTLYADGLHIVDQKTGKQRVLAFETRPQEERVLLMPDIMKDSKGIVWVLTRDVIYQYDQAKQKLVRGPQPGFDSVLNRSDFYYRILEDSRGDIWITTLRNGVYRYKVSSGRYEHYKHVEGNKNSLCSDVIIGITEDARGRIWLASTRTGVSVFEPSSGTFRNFYHDDHNLKSLSNDKVTAIVSDAKGFVWIATDGSGLSRIDAKQEQLNGFQHITTRDGLTSDIIISITDDERGNIWMATAIGLAVLDPVSMAVTSYTGKDGLRDDYKGYRLLRQPDGKMRIGSFGGYYEFNPSLFMAERVQFNLVINAFKVFDIDRPYMNEVRKKGSITLLPDENFFSFEFAALNLSDPGKFNYAYKLEGFDKDWVYCGSRRYVSYTNLPGGDYTFRVKAAFGSCTVCADTMAKELAIPIHIESPFWEQTWFIALAAGLISILVYGLYRFRIKQIQDKEKLKRTYNEKIADIEMKALRAQMNPHFIFNCLNSINRYIVKSDHATASLYLTRFSKLIRLILDNSNNKHILLSQELEALRLYLEMEALRFEKKFTYAIHLENGLVAEMIDVPPLIIQPYVENAIWHGLLHKETNGHLDIRLSLHTEQVLKCVIEDNGIGREKAMEYRSKSASTRKSLGMKLTQDRINILSQVSSTEASVQIVDLSDEEGNPTGTRVTMYIPVLT